MVINVRAEAFCALITVAVTTHFLYESDRVATYEPLMRGLKQHYKTAVSTPFYPFTLKGLDWLLRCTDRQGVRQAVQYVRILHDYVSGKRLR